MNGYMESTWELACQIFSDEEDWAVALITASEIRDNSEDNLLLNVLGLIQWNYWLLRLPNAFSRLI